MDNPKPLYLKTQSFNNSPRGYDRRFAFSRQTSFIDIPDDPCHQMDDGKECNTWMEEKVADERVSVSSFLVSGFRMIVRSGNRPMRRLLVLIFLNVAYSSMVLGIGLLLGRVGLASYAFHLTFGCGLLTFSLFSVAASLKKPDRIYTYVYKRLEVLSALTNATAVYFVYLFLLGCGSTSCIYTRRIGA